MPKTNGAPVASDVNQDKILAAQGGSRRLACGGMLRGYPFPPVEVSGEGT